METTGLADPAPVLMSITDDEAMSKLYRVECVVTTVDSVAGLSQIADHPESVKQASVADVILLTKSDLAGSQQAELRAEIEELNRLRGLSASRGEVDQRCCSISREKPARRLPAAGSPRLAIARRASEETMVALPPVAALTAIGDTGRVRPSP